MYFGALIILEVVIRGSGNATTSIIRFFDEIKQKDTEEYKEEKEVERIVAVVEELFQNKDVNGLYNLLDEKYKDFRFDNKIENFEEFIKKYINDSSSVEIQNYYKNEKGYFCSLVNYGNDKSFSFNVLIIENPSEDAENDESFTIAFDNLRSITEYNLKANSDKGLAFNLKYVGIGNNSAICTMEIENTGNKELNYVYKEVYLIDELNTHFNADMGDSKIALKPGEKTRQIITFSEKGLFMHKKNYLSIRFGTADDDNNIGIVNIDIKNVSI